MALSFLQTATNTLNNSTYTFTSQNVGAASSDRYVVAVIFGYSATSGRTVSSVTIGGISATISVQTSNASTSRVTAIALANVPTGATANVVVDFSDTMNNCGIGLYRLTEISTDTPFDTGTAASNTDETLTTSIDIPANGFAIAINGEQTTTNPETHTWTGLTEDFDTTIELGQFTGASLNPSTVQTGLSVSSTVTGTSQGGSLCVASYEFSGPSFVPVVSFFD